jgi:hypothetical protein
MKKNKKRKERMAVAATYTNPMNQKYESPQTLKRQREEDDFVNGKKDKVKQVDSPQKKRKEKHGSKGKETPKSSSQKSPSKLQKSPEKANGSKTSNTIPSTNGDSKPEKIKLADLFSESDRLLPGSKRKEMVKSYTSSKPCHPQSSPD